MQIQGQWFGSYRGTNSGYVVLNLDRRPGGFSGSGSIVEDDQALPSATHFVVLKSSQVSEAKYVGHADLNLYFRNEGTRTEFLEPARARSLYPGLLAEATRIQLEGEFKNGFLSLGFVSNANTLGTALLERVPFETSSKVHRRPVSWAEFKVTRGREVAAPLLFRGQPASRPLRTSFHRSGRYDAVRFALEDFSKLRNAINSIVDHQFEVTRAEDIGAIVGIAQHHGYPTPFLDWTKSPYIAAYFACREALVGSVIDPTIFQFDRARWLAHNSAEPFDLSEPLPALAFLEPTPMKNPRLVPQKSILMYCNVDNMEHFVARKEQQNSATYLTAYRLTDPPLEILKDLRAMGIDAASLFPGLDGKCRSVLEDSVEGM
jgi:hypothetical protein